MEGTVVNAVLEPLKTTKPSEVDFLVRPLHEQPEYKMYQSK